MRILDVLRLRWRSLTGRPKVEDSLGDEMRFHLEQLIAEKRQAGLSSADARLAALKEFGNPALLREDCRDARGVAWIENLIRDTRYGWRTFLRNPAFTVTAVLSLALGIGGAMAVFTIIESVMLRSLPVRDPHELVTLECKIQNNEDVGMRLRDFERITASTTALRGSYATSGRFHVRAVLNGDTGDQAPSARVTHPFFDVLGLRPAAGRFFAPEDEQTPDSAFTTGSVVVISHGFWARHFNLDPNAVGKTLLLNQVRCRVIGVAPQGFQGDGVGEAVDLWTPMIPFLDAKRLDPVNGNAYGQYMARLAPGANLNQAQAQLTAAYQAIQSTRGKSIFYQRRENAEGWRQYSPEPKDYRVVLSDGRLGFDILRTQYQKPLLLLFGATLLVFLTGCANVASLLLTRGILRRHEFGIRQALGAGRGRVFTQLLTECLLLAAAASVAGLAAGYWGSRTLVALVDLGPSPGLALHHGWRLAAFLSAMAVTAVALFGIAPAVRQSRAPSSRPGAGPGRQWTSRALLVMQVAMSIVLLSGAALLAQSIRNLRNQDFGFNPDRVIAVSYWLNAKDKSIEHARAVSQGLLARAETLPGVASASIAASGFFSGRDMFRTVVLPGTGAEERGARIDFVSPRYFETMGVSLLSGSLFQNTGEAVVNEAFARKLLGGGNPVGMELRVAGSQAMRMRITGVVRDARYRNARIDAEPGMFFDIKQSPRAPSRLELRTAADPRSVIDLVRSAVVQTDPDVVIESVSTLTAGIDKSFQRELLLAKLVSAFSALALTLSCIGLYGMMSYSVSRRVNEFGVRMALGARPRQLMGMVLRDSGWLLLGGTALGIPCAWAASRFIESYLYGVRAQDPRTVAAVTAVLAVAGLLAAFGPARRASSVDPATALRTEV